MLNEATKKAIMEQKDKLMLAESAAEIKAKNADSGTEIDDDELDAVSSGALCGRNEYCTFAWKDSQLYF